MKDLFDRIAAKSHDTDFSLTVSYLEIYNETIRDLLAPESGPLALRESNGVATPAGLSTKEPTSASDVVEWIMLGNGNRTVNATEANATSSRSHAVLTVTVTQKLRGGGLTEKTSSASLSVIDLAGSERASVTKNKGDRLIEGANINRSLLALGNCINALCDPRKRGHVPYRDSKLTRLLKQSLGGNCKTVMIVCVSPSSSHYDETHNTLQYANRAKEIKTKAIRNVVSVDRHVQDYCRAIAALQKQVAEADASFEARSAKIQETTREHDKREVETALRKLRSSWGNVYSLSVRSEKGRVEKACIDAIVTVLRRWKSTAFSGMDDDDPSTTAATFTVVQAQSTADVLINALANSSRACSAEFPHSSSDMFKTLRDSLSSKLTPGAQIVFALEVKLLELQMETARSQAREEGLLEGTRVQARAMSAMCEARLKVGEALDSERDKRGEGEKALRRLVEGIDHANREALLALTLGSHLSLLAGPSLSSSAGQGTKRDTGTRSPLNSDYSAPKSSRVNSAGPGSIASGSAASPQVLRARRSPKKSVIIPIRGPKNLPAKSSPRKRKAVQWRDETGDGWDIADVKMGSANNTPEVDPDATTVQSTPLGISPFVPTPPASGVTAADMLAASKRSAMGSLRSKSLRISPLASLSEESIMPKAFSFAQEDTLPQATRSTYTAARAMLSDVGNSSVSSIGESEDGSNLSTSMASTSSGLFMPLTKAKTSPSATRKMATRTTRRNSTIGPLRSTKPSRRVSNVGTDVTNTTGTRSKASRVASKKPVYEPLVAQRSPKKVSISTGWTPGANSVARIAARRESSATNAFALPTSGAGESIFASGPSLRSLGRESLAGAGGKSGVWR